MILNRRCSTTIESVGAISLAKRSMFEVVGLISPPHCSETHLRVNLQLLLNLPLQTSSSVSSSSRNGLVALRVCGGPYREGSTPLHGIRPRYREDTVGVSRALEGAS
jgi:hypothetical protein